MDWIAVVKPWAVGFLIIGGGAFSLSLVFILEVLKSDYVKGGFVDFLRAMTFGRFLALGLGAYITYIVFTTSVNMIFGALVVILGLNVIWFVILSRLSYVVICVFLWLILDGRSLREWL